MRNNYIRFDLQSGINYCYLLRLYKQAEYNKITMRYDTISYNTITELAELLCVSSPTVKKILEDTAYNKYFIHDKSHKMITLQNNFRGKKGFVVITDREIDYLLNPIENRKNDSLRIQYYLYLKYYCGTAERYNKKQDFTIKQFLSSVGKSVNSKSYISLVSSFNTQFCDDGLISIEKYIDGLGYQRNFYSINKSWE